MYLMDLWSLVVVDLTMVLAVSAIANMMRALGAPRVRGSVVLPLGPVRTSVPLGAVLVVNAAVIALAVWFQLTEPHLYPA